MAALRLLSGLLFGEGPPPRHPHFASIPPPDGYGLEITGNRERYYDAPNSLLDHVLINREGIPISLAVLHAAVGARAGLPISVLGVPMHVVTAMEGTEGVEDDGGGPGLQAGRVFIDVFDGGRIMSRAEFVDFLRGLGLPASHADDVEAMSPPQTWLRMCRNLLHIHREHAEHGLLKATALLMAAAAGEGSAEGVRATVEAANACMAQQQYHEAAELLEQLVDQPFQVQVGHAAGMHAPALAAMLAEIRAAAEEHVRQQMQVHRRVGEAAAGVSFRVGQLIRHRRYAYRGVIVGWDTECRASEEWVEQMGVARLAGGRAQPFYHVLPDPADRPGQVQTYVAQENIELEALPPLHSCKPGFAVHPDAGRFFSALQPDGAAYQLAPWLRRAYPQD